jgi:hypothetical protein
MSSPEQPSIEIPKTNPDLMPRNTPEKLPQKFEPSAVSRISSAESQQEIFNRVVCDQNRANEIRRSLGITLTDYSFNSGESYGDFLSRTGNPMLKEEIARANDSEALAEKLFQQKLRNQPTGPATIHQPTGKSVEVASVMPTTEIFDQFVITGDLKADCSNFFETCQSADYASRLNNEDPRKLMEEYRKLLNIILSKSEVNAEAAERKPLAQAAFKLMDRILSKSK